MGSIVNGISLTDGMLKPYGSTFLIFSDYMRPAVRLSALGHMQSLWVWTHDSVGLGEDGPTHQPVEHHMTLRSIPNLWYVRPGDANETSMAWRIALEREGGPVALALSRQKLPTLDRSEVAPAEGALRGAYTLWQSGDGLPDIVLLATGSEVGLAYEAARSMDANVRVVSMPCWELFAEQPQDYRDEVIPPDVGARLSVEAGISLGWERWIGDAGASVAVDRFGASAPGDEVLERLGFTAENVAARAVGAARARFLEQARRSARPRASLHPASTSRILDGLGESCRNRLGDRVRLRRVDVQAAVRAVAGQAVADVEVLLEVIPEREVEERRLCRDELHPRREPALDDRHVADRQVPVQLVHVLPNLDALGSRQGARVDPRPAHDDHAQRRDARLRLRVAGEHPPKQVDADAGAADGHDAHSLVLAVAELGAHRSTVEPLGRGRHVAAELEVLARPSRGSGAGRARTTPARRPPARR